MPTSGGCSTEAVTQTSSVRRSVSCTDVPPPGASDTWGEVNGPTTEGPTVRVETREAGTMYTIARDEIVAQHVADLHRQAARQRLVRELRARRKPTAPRPRIWERLTIRRP
jgi:hypothetical protein